jgi:hypothetical protein
MKVIVALLLLTGVADAHRGHKHHPSRRPKGWCGEERWNVKIGIDDDAAKVDVTRPTRTTIADLRALAAPAHLDDATARGAGTERTAFQLTNVHVTYFKHEAGKHGDDDFHIVVADDQGQTMIVEVPAPSCMLTSPWADAVRAARQTVVDNLHPRRRFNKRSVDRIATVVGVGFFDKIHGNDGGQRGHADNGIELHPVLDICFGTDCVLP